MKNGYLFATLESNIDVDVPTVGFWRMLIHHPISMFQMLNCKLLKTMMVPYKLGNTKRVLDPKVFPELNSLVGHTLMVTDGTSLLGADDKAGVLWEIMEAFVIYKNIQKLNMVPSALDLHQTKKIGRGPHKFDADRFQCRFCFILWMVINMENYNMKASNAAEAIITPRCECAHPGSAKCNGKRNTFVGEQSDSLLPDSEVPERNEGYEGFYHLMNFEGTVEKATLQYIIRDHDKNNSNCVRTYFRNT